MRSNKDAICTGRRRQKSAAPQTGTTPRFGNPSPGLALDLGSAGGTLVASPAQNAKPKSAPNKKSVHLAAVAQKQGSRPMSPANRKRDRELAREFLKYQERRAKKNNSKPATSKNPPATEQARNIGATPRAGLLIGERARWLQCPLLACGRP
jgi:hypothetical protein